MASQVPVLKLSDGNTIPQVGLGTWKSKPGEVTQAVKDAIDIGYRHIDCAFVYGNEKEVGEAITSKIAEGVVKRPNHQKGFLPGISGCLEHNTLISESLKDARTNERQITVCWIDLENAFGEDLFITSKLWNTFHRPDLVRGALLESLKNLNLDYLDLYLIHWPQAYKEGENLFPVDESGKIQFSDVDYVDTWKALEPLRAEGLVKSLGVSNFNARQLERLLEHAAVKPVVNQVECHPYLTQHQLQAACAARGVALAAYSPLGSPDRPWALPEDPRLLDDQRLLTLAEKLGRSVAQVLIRYQLDRGHVVIPKSVTRSRIADNFAVLDFSLSESDLALVDSFHCDGRFVPMTASLGHKDHPFENDKF